MFVIAGVLIPGVGRISAVAGLIIDKVFCFIMSNVRNDKCSAHACMFTSLMA